MKTLPHFVAATLVTAAIGTCLLFGTLGWFVIGFGVLTECTDYYSCSATNCAPCATTGLWINVGGLGQLLVASAGVGLLISRLRTQRSGWLAGGGAVLLLSSALLVLGTTWQAQGSYCQPGTPGYRSGYCSRGG